MNQDGQDLTQRVRIGLTGLACVFLLVLLGAILINSVNGGGVEESGAPALTASAADNAAMSAEHAPKEPLAELGITPGNFPARPDLATEGNSSAR